jgi:hypothetical protein
MSDSKRIKDTDSVDADINVNAVPYAHHVRSSPEEKQEKLDAALEVDPGVQAWTIRAIQVCNMCYL